LTDIDIAIVLRVQNNWLKLRNFVRRLSEEDWIASRSNIQVIYQDDVSRKSRERVSTYCSSNIHLADVNSSGVKAALPMRDTDLVMFADPDLEFPAGWVERFALAASSQEQTHLFYGGISATLTSSAPKWIGQSPLRAILFDEHACTRRPGAPTKVLSYLDIIDSLGSNCALRVGILKRIMRNRNQIIHSRLSYSQWAEAFTDMHNTGFNAECVPHARAVRRIPAIALRPNSILERAFAIGQAIALSGTELLFYPNEWLDTQVRVKSDCGRSFCVLLNLYYGQLYQAVIFQDTPLINLFLDLIFSLAWTGNRLSLCASLDSWLHSNQQFIPRNATSGFQEEKRS